MKSRLATPQDAAIIVSIYNQGIIERVATFETKPRSEVDIMPWFESRYPVVVVEDEHRTILSFASTSTYRQRGCYDGVAEFSVYTDRAARGTGAGSLAMETLIDEAGKAGFWKLISRIFPENLASLRLMKKLGFREVGLYRKHAKLDGIWRDVVIIEKLIGEAAE